MKENWGSYIKWFVVFFIIFYSENFEIQGITISQLWKIPLVLYMLYTVILAKKRKLQFIKLGYWLALLKLLNRDIIVAPLQGVILFTKYLNFPLLYEFIQIKIKQRKKILRFLVRFCQYCILSFIPFLLNILKEPKAAYGEDALELYEGAITSNVGLFQNPHGASVILSLSFFVILYFIKNTRMSKTMKYFNILLLVLDLYLLYSTYVRTGYLMFVVGLIVYLFPSIRQGTLTDIMKPIVALFIGTFLAVGLISSNDYFKARIFDLDENGDKREAVGSGRLLFAQNGLNLWAKESNAYEYILGHGQEAVRDNNARIFNNKEFRIYSHNGYVDSLAQNGIVGIIIMLLFYYYIFQRIRKLKKNPASRLALTWLVMQLVFQMVQGGVGFMSDLIAVLILVLLEYEERDRKRKMYYKSRLLKSV